MLDLITESRGLLVVRENLTDISDSVFAEFISVLSQYGLVEGTHYKRYKQPLKIEFLHNKSFVIARGASDEERLKSLAGITDCFVEEATEISYHSWNQLRLRLRNPRVKVRFFLAYNPVHKSNWCYEYWHVNPPADCQVIHSNYTHNKFLPQSFIDTLMEMKERDPYYYSVYALGEFGNIGERIYNNYTIQSFDLFQVLHENPKSLRVIGLDWGFQADPTAIIECVVDREFKKVYIHDEVYKKGMLNVEIANAIKRKEWHRLAIYADSAEQKSIFELRTQHGINRIVGAKKGKGSIMAGIMFLQSYDIIVHPRCKNTINELENYTYKTDRKTGEVINEPVDRENHSLDALRYVMEPFMKKRAGRTISKSALGL